MRGSRLPKNTNAAAASATCQRSHRAAACAIAASRYWTQDDRCPFPALALWPDRRRARLPARSVHQMGGHRAAVARDAARRAHFAGAGLRPAMGRKLRHFAVDVLALRRYAALDRSEEHTSELQSLMRISYAV